MTPLKPIENLFAVGVPPCSYYHEIAKSPETHKLELWYMTRSERGKQWWTIVLPPGSYEILFTTSNANDSDAEKICSSFELADVKGWRDYQNRHVSYPYGTALHGLQSLLRANRLDTKKNFLLIKKTT